eukprot:scaffold4473_cov421-Prasinococcus_capsulatus_cf.AAC.1
MEMPFTVRAVPMAHATIRLRALAREGQRGNDMKRSRLLDCLPAATRSSSHRRDHSTGGTTLRRQ